MDPLRQTDVEAVITGVAASSGAQSTETLALSHAENETNERVAYLPNPGFAAVTKLELRVAQRSGDPFPERYLLASLQPVDELPFTNEMTNIPRWVAAHRGVLSFVILEGAQPAGGINQTLPPIGTGHQDAGTSWLIRIEDDDPRLPWRFQPGSADCFETSLQDTLFLSQASEADCFDLETLCGAMLAFLTRKVTEGLAKREDGAFTIRAHEHHLSYVPNLPFVDEGFTGLALIYSVRVTLKNVTALAEAWIRIPIHLVFQRIPGASAPLTSIKPPEPLQTSEDLIGRLTVQHGAAFPAAAISDQVIAAIRADFLATLEDIDPVVVPMGDPYGSQKLGEALATLVFTKAGDGTATYPSNFAVAALPANLDGGKADTLLFKMEASTAIVDGDRVAEPGEDLTGVERIEVFGSGAGIDITTFLDADGKERRVTRLLGPEPVERFELWLLR